jgi:hypothetical protein
MFENNNGLFKYQWQKTSPKNPRILARRFMVVYLQPSAKVFNEGGFDFFL